MASFQELVDNPGVSSTDEITRKPATSFKEIVGPAGLPKTPYDDLIKSASEQHGVPYATLYRLLKRESSFNPKAENPDSSAAGIAQFLKGTAKDLGITDRYDPKQAIPGAAKYLKQHYDRFKDWRLAVAAYHSGPGAVSEAKGIPSNIPKGYVESILPDATPTEVKKVQKIATSFQELASQPLQQIEVPETIPPYEEPEVAKTPAEEFYTRKAIAAPFQGLIPGVWHPALAAELGRGPLGRYFPKPEGGWDEFGMPRNAKGEVYFKEGINDNEARPRPFGGELSISQDLSKPNFIVRAIKGLGRLFGAEFEPKLSESAKAQAVVKLMAKEEGIPLHEYRQSPELVEKAASSFVNTASFGMIPALEKATTGMEEYEATDMPGYIGDAMGSLGGLVFGPFKAVEPVLRSARFLPRATQGEKLASRIFKEAIRDSVTLGLGMGAAATGEALEKTTFSQAASTIYNGAKSGALTGSIFGMARGMFPKEGAEKAARLISGLVGLNALRAVEYGGNPFTDRPIGQVIFDVALDAYFLYRGLPKEFDKHVELIDDISKSADRIKAAEEVIKTLPPGEESEILRKVTEINKGRLEKKVTSYLKEFNGDLELAAEVARQAEEAAKGKIRPVAETGLKYPTEKVKKAIATSKLRAAAFKMQDGTIYEGATHPTIAMEQTELGNVKSHKDFYNAEAGFVTENGKFVDRKEANKIAKTDLALSKDVLEPKKIIKKFKKLEKVPEEPTEVKPSEQIDYFGEGSRYPEFDEMFRNFDKETLIEARNWLSNNIGEPGALDRLTYVKGLLNRINELEKSGVKKFEEPIDRYIERTSEPLPGADELITEVDRQTGTEAPVLDSEIQLYLNPKEKVDALHELFEERIKSVREDPEVYTQKLINDVNRWYYGEENVDIGAVRNALSNMAARAPELRELFMTGRDHMQFMENVSEAANWAQRIDRTKPGVRLNMMIPLDQMPDFVRLTARKIFKGAKRVNVGKLYRNKDLFYNTGFWLGRDGKWRYEIDDSGIKIDFPKDIETGKTVPLSSVFKSERLLKAVPEMSNTRIMKSNEQFSRYDPVNDVIEIGYNSFFPGKLRPSIVHETQHAVNAKTGGPRGTSIERVGTLERYQTVPGEMEARLAALRARMTTKERRQIPPWETLDSMLKVEGYGEGTTLYSGIPVEANWKYFRDRERALKDKIRDWLVGKTKTMPEPNALYRGTPIGMPVEEAAGRSMHGTPWPLVASSGGKFGEPGTHNVYRYPITKDTVFYRGGSLAGDPLESTRIPSAGGMTWSSILNKAKEIYYKDLTSERHKVKKYGFEASEDAVAERVIGDIRAATYEVDLSGKPGIWRGKPIEPDRNVRTPKLRSYEEVEETIERKRKQGYIDSDIPELDIVKRRYTKPSGVALYSGAEYKEIIKGIKGVSDYVKEARRMKAFKPATAAKMGREEFVRAVVDRSGNIRRELLSQLSDKGYEIVQRLYLSKGASARAANELKQMSKEVYSGLTRDERRILDTVILTDRLIDIAKYKSPKEFRIPKKTSLTSLVGYRELFGRIEKISPEKAADISRRANLYFEWMKKPLREMLDAELITKEEYDRLASHNYRRIKLVDVYDKRYGSKLGGTKKTVYDSGIESLQRGRDTDIYEPSSEVMALEVFNRAYGRILNNAANKSLLELAQRDNTNPFVRIKNKETKIPSDWSRIFVYDKGKRKSIFISPEMGKEWITQSPEISYKMGQVLRWGSGSPILRTFATGVNWGFALANLPRDVMHSWFAARSFEGGKWKPIYNPNMPVAMLQMGRDLATVFTDAATRGKRYQQYIKEGGGMEFLVHQGRLFQRGKHIGTPLDRIYDFMGYFGETSELMTRLAIRERLIRKGKSSQEATFAARDYMDFAQGGWATKVVDNGIPYLNASVQGTRGLWRALKDNPVASTYKLSQLAALTTGLYVAAKALHPKTMSDLQGNIDMQNNLVIPLGDQFGFEDEQGQTRYPYIKIPLDPGQKFFKTFFEASADKWLGNEVDVNRVIDSLKEQSPVGVTEMPPAVSALIGYATNKDFWMNEDIWRYTDKPFSYPRSREEYIPGRTPQGYIDFGQLTGLSPERTRYAVEELVTSGTVWSSLLNKGYEELFSDLPKDKKEQHLAMTLARTPVFKRFIGITNPYTKHITKVDKAEEEATLEKFVQNRGMDTLVDGYLYEDSATLKEIVTYAKSFKDRDVYNRLMDRFKWEKAIKDLPEKSFWKRMKGLDVSAKASLFVDRLNKANEEERKQLWKEYRIVSRAGGVISDSFREEVRNQIANR